MPSKGKFFKAEHNANDTAEVKADLMSQSRDKIRNAIKAVIGMLSAGTDIASMNLFPSVVGHLSGSQFEVKKLVYIFIINYAHSQPDRVLEIVAAIQRDCSDPSPVLRALALRTLASIRHERVFEFVFPPLKAALKDRDPYVRKTAAVCVSKLYTLKEELVMKEGFVENLRTLLSDPSPMVVANAVAGLSEITARTGEDVFEINSNVMQKLLTALNECTEWGQVYILDALANYRPPVKEAENIIERVTPRLQHVNSAVAMSAIRVIVNMLSVIQNDEMARQILTNKLPPPLVTLLQDNQPEMQYVALRNINLVVQKWPDILTSQAKHFFCKYNDPIYIKMEKLHILTALVSDDNFNEVLLEFREYAKEVDVDFVRSSVRAIGRCAVKLDAAAENCVKVLLELIQTKVNYVVQESIIVIKDIFRKYPNKYESVIATLCENLDTLDEPQAKAAMIWIIGEYAARIENVPALFEDFVDAFQDESPQVQLQLLTAVVKFFLRKPDEAKDLVTRVLNLVTEHADNPDLRDRGYVYWRLLSHDPSAAQKVVLVADRPVISIETFQLEARVLNNLLANLGTLASVYHKLPEAFVKGGRTLAFKGESESDSDTSSSDDDDDDDDDDEEDTSADAAATPGSSLPIEVDFLTDLAGDLTVEESPVSKVATSPIVLPENNAKTPGLQIRSFLEREDGRLIMHLHFENKTQQDLGQIALKFNKHPLGLQPHGAMVRMAGSVEGMSSGEGYAVIDTNIGDGGGGKLGTIQVACKTSLGVAFFLVPLDFSLMLDDEGLLQQRDFIGRWKALGGDEEQLVLKDGAVAIDTVERVFNDHRVFVVAKRQVPNKGNCLYCSLLLGTHVVLMEVAISDHGARGAAKCDDMRVAKIALEGIAGML